MHKVQKEQTSWSKALVRHGADGAALAKVLGVTAEDIRVREDGNFSRLAHEGSGDTAISCFIHGIAPGMSSPNVPSPRRASMPRRLFSVFWTRSAALKNLTAHHRTPAAERWRHPNVLITPHLSGESDEDCHGGSNIFCNNLRAYLDGRPPANAVDWDRGSV